MNLQPDVNWKRYFRELPTELTDYIRRYVIHCSRSCVTCAQEITPKIWFTYVETRLREDIKPSSLNTTLRIMQSFLHYLEDNDIPICKTMLEIRPLKTGESLPRDLTVSQIKILLQSVSSQMDRAWILLMLHSGLRMCEVRTLCWNDVDLKSQTIHINKSKGLQSRVVFLSPQAIDTLNCLPRNSEQVFTYRNEPLSRRYCQSRLTTIGKQCGFYITPHQLRHTCATMLLNAGMSILGVQKILGHKYVETTLRYARVYDRTVVKDFQLASHRP